MEIKTKNIIIYAAAAIGVYFIYQKFFKKTNVATTTPETNTSPIKSQGVVKIGSTTKYVYPYGFVEGDFVVNPNEQTVYLLHDGKRLPVTKAWWDANAADSWNKVKQVSAAQLLDIPVGDTLT